MNFALVSLVPEVPMSALAEIAAALMRQQNEDVADLWQESTTIVVSAFARVADASKNFAPVVLYRDADQPGELGDHETTPDGRPVGRIFAAPILSNGGTIMTGALSISQTFSHEVIEIGGDPYINFWADTPDGEEEAQERGDRVEGDFYDIDRVSVTNFLGPRAFSLGPLNGGSVGPFDRMGLLKSAWDMTAGGYKIRRVGGPTGTVKQVFGAHVPDWKRELLKVSKRHLARGLRVAA